MAGEKNQSGAGAAQPGAGSGSSGAAGGAGGSGGAGGKGAPAGGAAAPKDGAAGSQGGAGAGGGGTSSIPLDVLPEELRGKSAQEIKVILGRMTEAVATGNRTTEDLRRQLAELQNRPAPKPAEPDPDDEKDIDELLAEGGEKAEKAVLRVVQKHFGSRFVNVESTAADAAMDLVARNFDDFEEHRETIREIMEASGNAWTRDNIQGAYVFAVGQAAVQNRLAARKQTLNMETGDTPPALGGDEEEPTGLELEIAKALGQDPKAFRTAREVKVPTGAARK